MPRVERVRLDRLTPAPWNPREIRSARFKNLCDSIQADPGLLELRPVLATTAGVIYGGNQRYRAVQHLGWKDVPAELSDIPEQLAKERALKDNGAWGMWVEDDLGHLLAELKDAGSDIDLLGFDSLELDRLLNSVTQVPQEDAADLEPPSEPITKPGDLWLLDEHRLLCGDSTNLTDVERLMDGRKAQMAYCDPPYAVGVSTTGIQSSLSDLKILRPFFRDWLVCMATAIESGAHWYIATDWRTYPLIFEDVARYGLTNVIVWDYDWIKAGSQYRFRYELLMFGSWGETRRKVPRDEPDVWQIKAENFTVQRLHGAQKPTALIARTLANSSESGSDVLDLFGGSGSTLIAAEQANRTAYLMEIDPGYCDVIVNRWQKLTGKTATLAN